MGDSVSEIRFSRWVGRLSGGLLLTAGLLKFSADPGFSILNWRTVGPSLEILLSFWLFSAMRLRWALVAAAALFCSFTVVTLWKIAHGEADCGCFGAWSPSPGMTYWIDAAALTATVTALDPSRWRVFMASMLPSLAALRVALLFIAPAVQPPASIAVGERWPAHGAVDVDADLSLGRWVVVVYDSDCHRCESLAEDYAREASLWASRGKKTRLALLDVSHSEHADQGSGSREIARGTLLQRELYEHSPIVILLEEGRILEIRREWEAAEGVQKPLSRSRRSDSGLLQLSPLSLPILGDPGRSTNDGLIPA